MSDQEPRPDTMSDLPASLQPVIQSLAGMPLPAFVVDGEGHIRFANRVARQLGSRSEALERFEDLFEGEAPCADVVRMDAFPEGAGEILCHEVRGGQTFRMTCTKVDAASDGAYLVGVLHQGGDVIETSRSAQELREDAMQAIVDASSDAILLFDADFRCVLSNGLAQEATGYPAAELAFLTLMDLGVVKSPDEMTKLLTNADQGKPAGARGILQTGRGEKLPVRAQVGLLVGSATRIVGLCSFPPPRVTSGRLAAVRQSGSFARPGAGAGKASGSFARPVSSRASGGLPRPEASPAPGTTTGAAARPAAPKPSQLARKRPPSSPKGTLTGQPAPSAGPPGLTKPSGPGKATAPATPSQPAGSDKTEPAAPPAGMEVERVGGPVRSTGFEKPDSTLELDVGDLEQASVVKPPPPPSGGPPAIPTPPKQVVVQITANPPQVVAAGEGIEALLGYSTETVISWTAEQWLKEVHQPALADQLKQMWLGLVGQRFEPGALPDQTMDYPLVRQGGAVVDCSTTWRAVQAEDGAFEGLEIIIQPK